MPYVDIDVISDSPEELEAAMPSVVRIELLESNGPNGAPIYRVYGESEALKAMLEEYGYDLEAHDIVGS